MVFQFCNILSEVYEVKVYIGLVRKIFLSEEKCIFKKVCCLVDIFIYSNIVLLDVLMYIFKQQ